MNEAQFGAEAKPHSEGCQERIRQAMVNDEMSQQKQQEMKQRREATRGQVLDAPTTTEGQVLSAQELKDPRRARTW